MRIVLRTTASLLLATLLCVPAMGAKKDPPIDPEQLPWDKAFIQLGGFLTSLRSGFRLGADNIGLGLDLDVETFLGLATTTSAFRLDGGYRFTRNRRHGITFSWFRLDRSGENTLTQDVELPGGTVLPTGLTVSSIFNIDIYRVKYTYSFLLDRRIDIRIGGGLYVMPIQFGLGELGQERTEESITAPLPVLSIGFNFQLSPKWRLRQDVDFLFLEVPALRGRILDLNYALERSLSKHFGIGLGFELLDIRVQSDTESGLPGNDFIGTISFGYSGLQFYVRGRF